MTSLRWLAAIALAATSIATTPLTAAAEEELPRRGSLGIALGNNPTGLTVASVPEDAAPDTFEVGDELREVNGVPTPNWIGLQTAIHQLPSEQPVSVTVLRDGAPVSFETRTVPMPEAQVEGAVLTYGHVTTPSGLRIRTVTMVPDESALETAAGRPAVTYIQGITCQSIDGVGGPDHPRGNLFRRLLDAGFIVAFADKPGTGDSDGEPCVRGGFDVEVEAYTAAARALAQMPGVDADRLYAIGISMGGYQVQYVAEEVPLAGIVTWGSGVQPWADYIITNFRMRSAINPAQPLEASEQGMRDLREVMARALILDQSPEQIEREAPELFARFTGTFGAIDGFAGRSLRFHREVDAANGAVSWAKYDGALLALHGEYDWVATKADHRLTGALVTRDGKGSADFEIVPGADHGWTAHESLAASFQAPFAGTPDRGFHERATAWLTGQASAAAAGK